MKKNKSNELLLINFFHNKKGEIISLEQLEKDVNINCHITVLRLYCIRLCNFGYLKIVRKKQKHKLFFQVL